jgi:diadenosine tetraphosphate (Ap4A) HIT family hydrolase
MSAEAPPQTWSLHPQLEQDTVGVGDLPLSRLTIAKDANYPWLILVPRRPGIVEIIDLSNADQAQLMTEIADVSRALKDITRCRKLNVAALGNAVPQLHVHIIARHENDPAWPKPIWGHVPPKTYATSERDRLVSGLRRLVSLQ